MGADAADDVVSETLLSAWTCWASAPAPSGARRAWAFGIAHNRAVDHLRNGDRGQALLLRLASGRATTTVPAADAGALTRAGVQALVGLLPASERAAVLLTAVGGLTSAEAGTVLGCSQSAVTSRVARARRRLQIEHAMIEAR